MGPMRPVVPVVGVGSVVGVSVQVTVTGKVVSVLDCKETGAKIYFVDLGNSIRPFFKDQFL